MKDEEYTTSPNDLLSFSTDTVSFDTIISGSPTNTYSFKVYNRAKKAIRIPQVKLESGSSSPFKVNVDGTPLVGGMATDFEIASGDSMVVLLMANVPETDSDDPIDVEDLLVFTTEAGVQQKIVLEAAGQAVIPLSGFRVDANTVFGERRPYRVMDSLVVEAGCTLTLAAGTRLYFHPKAELVVHGTLQANGTLEQPVVMRGDRLGYMFDGQPYDRIPGQWGGVVFTKDSYGNHLHFTDIHSGSFGVRVDSSDVSQLKLRIENSVIHNSQRHGLDVKMANVYVGNSQITNAGSNCVHVRGGDVTFVHCTIARFYVFTGGSGVALDFANYEAGVRLPLTRLHVYNSIVTGYQGDELMGSRNAEFEGDAFNYAFHNCLLNTPKPAGQDASFVNCQWDLDDGTTPEGETLVTRDKNFQPEPDLDALVFSFELSPHSKAVGHADPEVTKATYPADRSGRERGEFPDIGCYQHQVPTEQTPE